MNEGSRLARTGFGLGLGAVFWFALVACGGGQSASGGVGGGSSGDSSGSGAHSPINCPAGQNPGCFGATADTCYCGPYCAGPADCASPNICTTSVCTSLQDYCTALLTANPMNTTAMCEPFQPQVTCVPSGAVANCSAVGLTCTASACCPSSMPYNCVSTGGCYNTAYEASLACGTECIACH
jgi:hypothetical protein